MLQHRPIHARRSWALGLAVVFAVAGIMPVAAEGEPEPGPEAAPVVVAEPAPTLPPHDAVAAPTPVPEPAPQPEPEPQAKSKTPAAADKARAMGPTKRAAEQRSSSHAPKADRKAPVVLSLDVSDVTGRTALIEWVTDEPSRGRVQFGATRAVGRDAGRTASFGREHEQTLRGLKPGTRYLVRVVSNDKAGNVTRSGLVAFRTKASPAPERARKPGKTDASATVRPRVVDRAEPRLLEPTPSPEPVVEPTPEPSLEPTPEAKPEATPAPEVEPTPTPEAPPMLEIVEPTPEPVVEPSPEPSAEPTPEPSVEPPPLLIEPPEADPSSVLEPLEPLDELAADTAPGMELPPLLEPLPSDDTIPLRPPPDAGPSVRSDKDDYAPGSLVLLTGRGWQPGETVELEVNDDEDRSWALSDTVVADELGDFAYEFRLPARFIAVYTVVASGEVSGQAVWSFTDAIGTGDSTDDDNGWFGSTEITLATPSTSAGDVLLANISVSSLGSGVICAPGGWTSVGFTRQGSFAMGSYYRVASGGEPASYTWQLRGDVSACGTGSDTIRAGATGAIISYSGIDSSSPIRVVNAGSGSGGTLVAPAAGGAQATDTVVRHFGSDAGTSLATASASSTGVSYSQVYSVTRVLWIFRVAPSIAAADADQPGSGSTGTLSATGGSAAWAAHTIVLAADAPTITLTIADDSAAFGTNLTPAGQASDSAEIDGVLTDTDGACYYWSGSIDVESSVGYRVEVTAADSVPRLRFHDTAPGTYAACAGGEQVDGSMFPAGSPPGTWVDGQTATSGRKHPLTLGLDVRWLDPPDADLGDTSITFTAVAD